MLSAAVHCKMLSVAFVLLFSVHTLYAQPQKTFYDFAAYRIDKEGTETYLSFRNFEGKILLVVNVASECGYTEMNYEELNRLYHMFYPTGKFEILAFPCNQFGEQEPQSNRDLYNHVIATYDVKFPIFTKIEIIGENAEPFYKWIQERSVFKVDWNFWKYIINANGTEVLGAWGPPVGPDVLLHVIERYIISLPDYGELGRNKKVDKTDEL